MWTRLPSALNAHSRSRGGRGRPLAALSVSGTATRTHDRPSRPGFTLIELLVAVTVTSLVTIALGGLTMAVQHASTYVSGRQDADMQGQITIERVRQMVSHAGVYRNASGRTILGLRVVKHKWSDYDLPDVLVVWSGGRNGGMAGRGTLDRLPKADELIVYAPDPDNPRRFLEYAFPNTTALVDFEAASFESDILALIGSSDAEPALLCDRLRVSRLDGFDGYQTQTVGNVRFEAESFPSDDEIASHAPGSSGWYKLRWSQGVVSAETGLRQTNVRIELQIETRPNAIDSDSSDTTSVPYFASAARRYAFEP